MPHDSVPTPTADPTAPEGNQFTIAGRVDGWEPHERQLTIGGRVLRVAASVFLVGDVPVGVSIMASGPGRRTRAPGGS